MRLPGQVCLCLYLSEAAHCFLCQRLKAHIQVIVHLNFVITCASGAALVLGQCYCKLLRSSSGPPSTTYPCCPAAQQQELVHVPERSLNLHSFHAEPWAGQARRLLESWKGGSQSDDERVYEFDEYPFANLTLGRLRGSKAQWYKIKVVYPAWAFG